MISGSENLDISYKTGEKDAGKTQVGYNQDLQKLLKMQCVCACVYCVCAAGWQCTSLTSAFVLFSGKLWTCFDAVEESVFSWHVTVPTLSFSYAALYMTNVVFKCSSTSPQASHLLIQQKATSRNRSAKLRPDPSRENAGEREPHSQNQNRKTRRSFLMLW